MPTTSRKQAAIEFLQLVVAGNIREAFADYVAPEMRHHNAFFPGDAANLQQAMEESHTQFPHKQFDIKHILEDGDLVAIHSHIRLQEQDRGFAVVHLFRFAGERMVEMWDLMQPVPEDSPNVNGIF